MAKPEALRTREFHGITTVVAASAPGARGAERRDPAQASWRRRRGREISVSYVRPGEGIGGRLAHILSARSPGARPAPSRSFSPDWQDRGAPLDTAVAEAQFHFLTEDGIPSRPSSGLLPKSCTTTATTSSAWATCAAGWPSRRRPLGVEIYPGFAAAEVLFHEDGSDQGASHRRHGHRARTAEKTPTTRRGWSCTPSTP